MRAPSFDPVFVLRIAQVQANEQRRNGFPCSRGAMIRHGAFNGALIGAPRSLVAVAETGALRAAAASRSALSRTMWRPDGARDGPSFETDRKSDLPDLGQLAQGVAPDRLRHHGTAVAPIMRAAAGRMGGRSPARGYRHGLRRGA
jgi:hypothetical protein